MLSQEVLDELNASGGVTGSVPGSLIAVPANQSALAAMVYTKRETGENWFGRRKLPLVHRG